MKIKYDVKSIFLNSLNNLLEKLSLNISDIDRVNIEIKKIEKLKNKVEQYKSAKKLVHKYFNM